WVKTLSSMIPETLGRTSAIRVGATRPGNSVTIGIASGATSTTLTAGGGGAQASPPVPSDSPQADSSATSRKAGSSLVTKALMGRGRLVPCKVWLRKTAHAFPLTSLELGIDGAIIIHFPLWGCTLVLCRGRQEAEAASDSLTRYESPAYWSRPEYLLCTQLPASR